MFTTYLIPDHYEPTTKTEPKPPMPGCDEMFNKFRRELAFIMWPVIINRFSISYMLNVCNLSCYLSPAVEILIILCDVLYLR